MIDFRMIIYGKIFDSGPSAPFEKSC